MSLIGHFIGGVVIADCTRSLDVFNPATGAVSKQLAVADRATVEKAIAAASAAFPAWRNTPAMKRARVMFRFKELLEANADKIVAMITEEHGKVHDDARGELMRGIEIVEYACGAPEFLKGEHSKNAGPGIDTWSEFQPLGVVVGITPFNFPAMVPLWMYPMALVCGNAFILKPSERDPSAPLFIGQLLKEAGLPDGVFNVVNGDKEAVDVLLTDPRIEAVSFVGSTPVAEQVYRIASENGKRCQALGGAKNHAIVMPDADVDDAADALMGAAYGSAGERCMAISVVVTVGDDTADALVEKLTARIAGLKVGAGTVSGQDMGPLITQVHQQRVAGYIGKGADEGAELVCDGRNLNVAGHENGYFLGASLFDRVKPDMVIYKDEIFGPVLCVVRASSLDEAMALIDEHEYGNGTCIFTRDGETARYFTDNIKVGMVGVNVPLPVPVASHSFGGWKRSLFGDLSIYGPDAVRFYTRRKTITQRWPASGLREGTRFAFPSSK